MRRPRKPSIMRRQLAVYSPLSPRPLWRAARSGLQIGPDPRPRLQARLRREFSAEVAVLCGSGSEALQQSLRLATHAVGSGVAVALPGFACYDIASAAVGANVQIALYDLDPSTLSPDLDSLRRALIAGARVVVVAHLYGVPVDWDALEACTAAFGAVLIEDAAQGHGARWYGRPLGSLGALSVLSFGRGKGWTGGQGGALLARSAHGSIAEALPSLPPPRMDTEAGIWAAAAVQWVIGRPPLYGLASSIPGLGLGETRYKEPSPPRGISRIAASLLEATYERSQRESVCRRTNAKILEEAIPCSASVRHVRLHHGGEPGFLRFPLRLVRGLQGFRALGKVARLGVAASYPAHLATLPSLQRRIVAGDRRWPGCEVLVRELVTLPTHSLVTQEERESLLRHLDTYAVGAQYS